MVGSAVVRRLAREDCEVVTAGARRGRSDAPGARCEAWLAEARPDAIVLAAAKVGGILANETLSGGVSLRQSHDRGQCHRCGASGRRRPSCCFSGRPASIRNSRRSRSSRSALLTGPLEPTNEGLRHRQDRRASSLPGLPPAVRARLHFGDADQSLWPRRQFRPDVEPCDARADPQGPRGEAARRRRSWSIWGTGTPRREFLHVDDCADALVHLMKVYSGAEHVNVGSGEELTILELAELVARWWASRARSCTTSASPTARRAS